MSLSFSTVALHVVLAALSCLPMKLKTRMLVDGANSRQRPTYEMVIFLLGHANESETSGPPGRFHRYLKYRVPKLIITIDSSGRVVDGGVVEYKGGEY